MEDFRSLGLSHHLPFANSRSSIFQNRAGKKPQQDPHYMPPSDAHLPSIEPKNDTNQAVVVEIPSPPPLPTQVLAVDGDSYEAFQILTQRLSAADKGKSVTRKAVILIGTLVAFVWWLSMNGEESGSSAIRNSAFLIGVLFIHELGHLLAMKIFGYRDLTMFFIPFFGAAVTGRHRDTKPWQEAVVSLAGPLPGIFFGVPAWCYGRLAGNPLLEEAGVLLVFLNTINMLPVKPLDGGRFFETVLFCRWQWLSRVFSILSIVGFALFLFFVLGISPLIVGLLALFQISFSLPLWKLKSALQAKAGHVFPQADGSISREQADIMFEAIRTALMPHAVKPAALAEHALQHLRRRSQIAPSAGVSIALILLYLLTLAYIGAGFVVVILTEANVAI